MGQVPPCVLPCVLPGVLAQQERTVATGIGSVRVRAAAGLLPVGELLTVHLNALCHARCRKGVMRAYGVDVMCRIACRRYQYSRRARPLRPCPRPVSRASPGARTLARPGQEPPTGVAQRSRAHCCRQRAPGICGGWRFVVKQTSFFSKVTSLNMRRHRAADGVTEQPMPSQSSRWRHRAADGVPLRGTYSHTAPYSVRDSERHICRYHLDSSH